MKCCGSRKETKRVAKLDNNEIKELVRERYAKVAEGTCCDLAQERSCCSTSEAAIHSGKGIMMPKELAKAVGYSEEIDRMPESVTESFAGCGNPVALATLKEGEAVLDLGAGAGLDAFLAAEKVGRTGRVIGLDMTPEMIQKAKKNAEKLGVKNVEFQAGDIEDMPIEDKTVDVIISNCVINLAPDKDKVFREAYRVLKPGGRMLLSDIVSESELPEEVRDDAEAWAGCIAGALPEKEYLQSIKRAGFVNVRVVSKASLGLISSDKIEAHKPSWQTKP